MRGNINFSDNLHSFAQHWGIEGQNKENSFNNQYDVPGLRGWVDHKSEAFSWSDLNFSGNPQSFSQHWGIGGRNIENSFNKQYDVPGLRAWTDHKSEAFSWSEGSGGRSSSWTARDQETGFEASWGSILAKLGSWNSTSSWNRRQDPNGEAPTPAGSEGEIEDDNNPTVDVPPLESERDVEAPDLVHTTNSIQSSHNGQVIENLDIYVASGDAITVTHDNVTIRNVRIHHEDGRGIYVNGAQNVTIESTEVSHAAPPNGIDPHASAEYNNIETLNCPNVTISDVLVQHGSSGIYLVNSPGAEISNVEGYNFHGPFPRGQFVQFNNSGDSSLTDFYSYNAANGSHPEDIVSVYYSPNVTIARGVVDGNNSVTGVGVMFEGNSEGGKVMNVDAINQGNGAFSSYSDDVEFSSTRSFDSIHGDQGRGPSSSNGLIWNVSADGVKIIDSTYTNAGNPGNVAWDQSRADVLEVSEDANAYPMSPIGVDLGWT